MDKEATLMLTFDANVPGMYQNIFPVCWKTFDFPTSGTNQMTKEFRSELAFCKPAVSHDKLVNCGTYVLIQGGQKTTLTKIANDVYTFSHPEADGGNNTLKAYNDTSSVEDIAIGVIQRDSRGPIPAPLLYFKDVPVQSFVQADFMPILSVYVTSQYQEGQIIWTAVDTPPIFEQNLATLGEDTVWELKYDLGSDRYILTKA